MLSALLSSYLLYTGDLGHFSLWCPNLCQLWYLSGFRMYISTLVVVYFIFILVGSLVGGETENICICLNYLVIFLDKDSWGISNTFVAKVGFFISSRVQRERCWLLTTIVTSLDFVFVLFFLYPWEFSTAGKKKHFAKLWERGLHITSLLIRLGLSNCPSSPVRTKVECC